MEFCRFPRLPAEIRNKIWEMSLPNSGHDLQALLYPYQQGCWVVEKPPGWDEEYDQSTGDVNSVEVNFRVDRLSSHVSFEVTIAFVSSEARSIATWWIHKQRLRARVRDEGRLATFVRPFDITQDAVYVADHRWTEFQMSLLDRTEEADMSNRVYGSISAELQILAVPSEVMARREWYLEAFNCLRLLLVVVEGLSNVSALEAKAAGLVKYCEIDSSSYRWNQSMARFEIDGTASPNDPYTWLEDALAPLGEELVRTAGEHLFALEVRPVKVVRMEDT